MIKIKNGDKVIVKKPEEPKVEILHWSMDMDNYVGDEMTVCRFDPCFKEFSVEECGWWFHMKWITHVNGIPVDKNQPTRQDYPYENWKMSISKDKFVRCITPLADDGIVVEGVYGYVDKVHNKFYYHVHDGMDKYIVTDVYSTDKGYEFVRDNKDSEKVSSVEEVNDIMDAVTATREGILASFGLPTDTPTYNPVKNISRNKFLRCVDMCKEKVVFNNLDGSNTYWMDKSPCGKYYYWDKHNRKNEIIYFRGKVDWVEKNYRKDNPDQRERLADLAERLRDYYEKKDPVYMSSDYWTGVKSSAGINASLEDNVEDEYTGGSVNYYKLRVENPTNIEHPYEAECNDIIETLDMNYAEGNAFKAIWRKCAARKFGVKKKGYDNGLYDSEKVVFFGERMVEQSKW